MQIDRDITLFLVIDDHEETPGAHLYHPDGGYLVFAGTPRFAVERMVNDDEEAVEYRSRFGFEYSNDDMRRIFASHDGVTCCPGDCEEIELMLKRRDLITNYILMYPNVPTGEEGTDRILESIEDEFLEELENLDVKGSAFSKLMQKLAGFRIEGFRYVANVDRSGDGITTTDGAIGYPIRVRVFAED